MASQSIRRAGVNSPVGRVFIKPGASRSILKRPAPLPLSPNPIQFTPSFSVIINSSHLLSPHVHFPSSPSLAATLTTYSPNTYDRGPIPVSPVSGGGAGLLSPWNNKALSPTAHNAFKLLDPPKRSRARMMEPVAAVARTPRRGVSTFSQRLVAPPVFEDPRSPKPYKPGSGVTFDELTLYVPRTIRNGGEELGRALSTYPRSPYPSAPPIEEEMADSPNTNSFLNVPRARSLPNATMKRRQQQQQQQQQQQKKKAPKHVATDSSSPLKRGRAQLSLSHAKPAPLHLVGAEGEGDSLSQAFWQSVSLEREPSSATVATANAATEDDAILGLKSPLPNIMFGNRDGTLWSPRVPKKAAGRAGRGVAHRGTGNVEGTSLLSPAVAATRGSNTTVFSKSMVASPTPNDPFASFPSFSIALMSMDGAITYPPRARVERD